MSKAKDARPRGKNVQQVSIGSSDGDDKQQEIIKVNDCVLINPDSDQGTGLPYIGQITELVKPDDGSDIRLHVTWFYRPEEALGGRKAFHGEKELFRSDHTDWCSYRAVMSKCRVLSLSKYQELPNIEETDFFARFMYRPSERIFEPPKVPVFCLCEMPYNPDRFMVQCDQCAEWYHPECLKTSRKALKHVSNWKCPTCLGPTQSQASKGAPAVAVEGRESKRHRASAE